VEEAARYDIYRGEKQEKERVDIHPYMNGNHITYVPHIFIDRNNYLSVAIFIVISWQRTGICASIQKKYVSLP
jgi:hypothetical protein